MDKNFILAISLSLLVLVGSQYLLQRFEPPPEVPEIIETEGKEIETSKTAPRANNKPLNAGAPKCLGRLPPFSIRRY